MKKKLILLITIISMICVLAACGKGNASTTTGDGMDGDMATEAGVNLDITMEQIIEANHYENILKNHNQMFYSTNIYMVADEGFLGYDSLIAENTDNGIRLITTGAAQSEGFTQEIKKNDDGTWVKRTQGGADEIEETPFADEAAAMAAIAGFEKLDRSNVESETIKSVTEENGLITVTTDKKNTGDAESHEVVYQLNVESLAINSIYEVVHTETDYGDLAYDTQFGYDTEAGFDIQFFDDELFENDDFFTSDEYMEMSMLLSIIDQESDDATEVLIAYCEANVDIVDSAKAMKMTEAWLDEMVVGEEDIASNMLEKFEAVWPKAVEQKPELDTDPTFGMVIAGIGTALRSYE